MTVQKYTITKTYRNDKDKQGVPLVSKTGKPYTKLALKVKEIGGGETWLSGFGNKTNEQWKEGDQVDLIVTQNGQYYNFDTPKAEDFLKSRIVALEVQMMNITNKLSKMQPGAVLEQPAHDGGYEPTQEELNAVLPKEEAPDF